MRRVTLEVAADDAGRAAALLAAASGALVAADQREGARTAAVSVYLTDGACANTVRRLRPLVAAHLRDGLLRRAAVHETPIKASDWADEWKKFHAPLRIADQMYVVPTWHTGFMAPSASDVLALDPGMAFGTGRHPTTQLAARLMLERVRHGDVVIDAGCGSGILALAAIVRGARAFGFDDDRVAVRTALANLSRNGVRAETIVRANQIPKRFPPADIVVANIDAPALAGLAKSFAASLKHGGALISSGVSARSRLEVLAAYALAGLRFCSEHRRGVWFAYVHEKP